MIQKKYLKKSNAINSVNKENSLNSVVEKLLIFLNAIG